MTDRSEILQAEAVVQRMLSQQPIDPTPDKGRRDTEYALGFTGVPEQTAARDTRPRWRKAIGPIRQWLLRHGFVKPYGHDVAIHPQSDEGIHLGARHNRRNMNLLVDQCEDVTQLRPVIARTTVEPL